MIRSVIIDDEKNCRESLSMLINGYFQNVEILGEADNTTKGFELINQHKPDLVFLDIMMPGEDGFQLLSRCNDISFEVIFTTAYDEYAIQALRFSALDYLLKPVGKNNLKDAIARLENKISITKEAIPSARQRIFLTSNNKYIFLHLNDIIRLEANGRQVVFHTSTHKDITVYKNFSDYENMLPESQFFKAHRSHIVNLNGISEYLPDRHGGVIIMNDKKVIPLVENKKKEFETWLNAR